MSFLLKLFKKTKQFNVTFCGLDKAGKTAIVNYLIYGEFKDTIPTMGINREIMDLPGVQFNIFDLGGQEDFRPMWSDINEKSDGIVFVIDSTDHLRMDESKKILYNVVNIQNKQGIPVLILLNKIDLPERISRVAFIEKFNFSNLSASWACFETSAKTGEGLFQAFTWFVNQVKGGKK